MYSKVWYTAEGLAERIREIRKCREILLDREAELILLHSAAMDYRTAVDEHGQSVGLKLCRTRRMPRNAPLRQAAPLAAVAEAPRRRRSPPASKYFDIAVKNIPLAQRTFRPSARKQTSVGV